MEPQEPKQKKSRKTSKSISCEPDIANFIQTRKDDEHFISLVKNYMQELKLVDLCEQLKNDNNLLQLQNDYLKNEELLNSLEDKITTYIADHHTNLTKKEFTVLLKMFLN